MHDKERDINKIKVVQMSPDHITGEIEYFSGNLEINEKLREQQEPSSAFRQKELVQVTATAELKEYDNRPVLVGTISNKRNKPITSVAFRIVAKNNKEAVLWDRIIRVMVSIKPASSGAFRLMLTDIHDVAFISWTIKEVHG